MTISERIQISPTEPVGASSSVLGSITRNSTHGKARPTERNKSARGPSGSWSSGIRSTTVPEVSVMP